MKILLIVCSMIVAGGAVTRFVASFDRKKPLWSIMFWSFAEICSIIILFNNFTIVA